MAMKKIKKKVPGGPYVPLHTEASVERAITGGSLDLAPWAWFSLGWHIRTLPVWLAFAEKFQPDDDDAVRSSFRSIPTTLYYVRTALRVLDIGVPERVRQSMYAFCERLQSHNDELAQGGSTPVSSQAKPFEPGTGASTGLAALVNDLDDTAAANRHWLVFGRELGAWYTFEQFNDRRLAESLDEIFDICREMPRSVETSVPLIRDVVRLAEGVTPGSESLSHTVCRMFNPNVTLLEGLSDNYVSVRLHEAVPSFVAKVHTCLLRKRHTPVWMKEVEQNRGVLLFREQTVRVVIDLDKAKNVVKVLDGFEEEGWPEWIDNPLRNTDGLLGQTLTQLRKNLKKVIQVKAGGKGTRIGWSSIPASPLQNSTTSLS